MNISTVAKNLRNTLEDKEAYIQEIAVKAQFAEYPVDQVYDGMVMMLAVNIAELKRILKDVEQCVKQASDDSWITNPDRMGGGGWTAEELDPNRGWK